MTLRRGLLLVAALSIVVGALLIALGQGVARAIGGYLLFEALVCLLLVLLERSHYRPSIRHPARLRPTGERLVDPTSGQVVEIWEDPATGEREYRQGRIST